jgi:hypothetical protein
MTQEQNEGKKTALMSHAVRAAHVQERIVFAIILKSSEMSNGGKG